MPIGDTAESQEGILPAGSLVVVAGLDSSSASAASDPQRSGIALDLGAELRAIADRSGWTRIEVAHLIGCDKPDPESWLEADLHLLEQSLLVSSFISNFADSSGYRSGSFLLEFLQEQAEADGVGSDLLATTGLTVLLDKIEARSAYREGVLLALELLSRVRADVLSAHRVLRVSQPISAPHLVRRDQLGSARAEILRGIADTSNRTRRAIDSPADGQTAADSIPDFRERFARLFQADN